jgi:hypothetical protein
MILTKASIKNLQRKGPPPLAFALGPTQPWGSVELEEMPDDTDETEAAE